MDIKKALASIGRTWDESILPELMDYVRIPNKSPDVRPRVGRARPHGSGRAADASLGRGTRAARHAHRSPAHSGPHAAADAGRAGPGRRLRADVRPPRQAARVHGLVRRPGAVDAGAARRKALWSRRGRRRLRTLRLAHCAAHAARTGRAARTGGDPHRSQRGKRQPRPRAPHRGAGRPPRHAIARRVPGCRVRQLRPALGDDVAARQPDRHVARGRADRRRSLGDGERDRPVQLPRTARDPRPGGGREFRRHPDRGTEHRHPAGSSRPGPGCGGRSRQHRLREVSAAAGNADGFKRSLRTAAEQHVATDAERHRSGRPAREPQRGERAEAGNHAEAVVPAAADAGRRSRVGSRSRCARARPSLRRGRQRPDRIGDGGVERARGRPLARAVDAAGVARVLRPRRDVHGNRWEHPVHGHARAALPGHAVPHHRRCWGRSRTPTARTSSCTSRPASA